MNMVSSFLVFMIMVVLGVAFASIAISYLPESMKKWIKNKLFKEKSK